MKVGEEYFIEADINKVKRDELMTFVELSQALSLNLSVDAWRIAQTGFDHDINKSYFVRYTSCEYPLADVARTIAWYEDEYLCRW
ncbi:hypothetical protein GCM10011297_29050 [Bacterioplanes sanyensis]|uniref:hypothetical protein n=1 Tax=Bacterioplanes sanyensis TaxID=1249553 RepID=UPI0016757468|nr:hypothetical protein [Bacterioplanes sanyensis]GGY54488.1 hypothetical protein GCM10011297_29050 [Bacterioplanes sanyensis]